MAEMTEEIVAREVRDMVFCGNLDTLTARSVMNTIGDKFGVQDMRPWKQFVNQRIDVEINALDQRDADETTTPAPEAEQQDSEPEEEKPQASRKLSVFKKPIVVLEPLASLVGDDIVARSEISKRIIAYAKANKLQNQSDGRKFSCDQRLHTILGTDEFTMFSINKLVVPLLKKPEDCGEDFVVRARALEEELTAEMLLEEPKKKKAEERKGERKLSGLQKPVVLLDPLKSLLGEDLVPRSQLVKRISEYARQRSLQDPNDGRKILCDDRLKEVFGVDNFTFFSVNKLVVPMLKKPEECGEEMVKRASAMADEMLAAMGDDDGPPKRKRNKTTRGA